MQCLFKLCVCEVKTIVNKWNVWSELRLSRRSDSNGWFCTAHRTCLCSYWLVLLPQPCFVLCALILLTERVTRLGSPNVDVYWSCVIISLIFAIQTTSHLTVHFFGSSTIHRCEVDWMICDISGDIQIPRFILTVGTSFYALNIFVNCSQEEC